MWKVCSYTGVIFVISKLFFSLNLNVSAVWSLSIWSLRFHLCSPVWYAFLVCLTLFSLCQHHPEKNTVYAKLKSEDSVKQYSTLNKTQQLLCLCTLSFLPYPTLSPSKQKALVSPQGNTTSCSKGAQVET